MFWLSREEGAYDLILGFATPERCRCKLCEGER
jgi:hypothetical protein